VNVAGHIEQDFCRGGSEVEGVHGVVVSKSSEVRAIGRERGSGGRDLPDRLLSIGNPRADVLHRLQMEVITWRSTELL